VIKGKGNVTISYNGEPIGAAEKTHKKLPFRIQTNLLY